MFLGSLLLLLAIRAPRLVGADQQTDLLTFKTQVAIISQQLNNTFGKIVSFLNEASAFVIMQYEQSQATADAVSSGGGGQTMIDFSSRLPIVFGDLTYLSASQSHYGFPYAVDKTPIRKSEFIVFSGAISTAPIVPYPNGYTTNDGKCKCAAAWKSWCTKVNSTGDICNTPCSRACDLYWATDATSVLDPMIPVFFKAVEYIKLVVTIFPQICDCQFFFPLIPLPFQKSPSSTVHMARNLGPTRMGKSSPFRHQSDRLQRYHSRAIRKCPGPPC